MSKTIERVPLVKPGLASCLACVRANLRGGDNTCPIKELRDHPDPANSRMARSAAGEQFECGSFKPLNIRQGLHRTGGVDGQEANGQEALF